MVNEMYGKRVAVPEVMLTINLQNEMVQKWGSYDADKKAFILDTKNLLFTFYQVYPHCIPLKREHMKYTWGKQLMKSMPSLKPYIEGQGNAFAVLAKKKPNWQEEMEETNEQALKLYIARKQVEYDRMLDNLKKMGESMEFSNKMIALQNAISRAPAGTTVNVTIRP
jgi:hypothetical protein